MRCFLLLVTILFCCCQALAQGDVESRINSEINKLKPELDIAIYAKNITKDKEIYSRNIERYYDFASSLKLVSMLTLLDYFGPKYQFKNRLSADDKSNYYLQIHDPNFNRAKLKQIISALPKVIDGDIIIVDSNFSLPPVNRHKTIADSKYCYGSKVSKVHLGQNCLKFGARPAKPGERIVIPQADLPYKIQNKTRTIGKDKLDRLHTKIQLDNLAVTGTLAVHNGPLSLCVAVENNTEHVRLWVEHIIKASKKKMRGKVLVKNIKIPAKSSQIYAQTITFTDSLKYSLRESNNYTTDYILAEFANRQRLPEWRQAGMALKKLIKQQYDVDFSTARIKDASGLAINNTIYGPDVAKFLEAQAKTANFKQKLRIMDSNQLSSLKQGTIKKHQLEKFIDPKKISIYAKTGKKTGIVSLIGFAKKKGEGNKDGDLISFIIVMNNAYFDENQRVLTSYLDLQSKILAALVE